jgi:hypothetical protein
MEKHYAATLSFLLAALFYVIPGYCETHYRAHYQLNVKYGDENKVVTFAQEVQPNVPTKYEFGKYIVLFNISVPDSSGAYALTILLDSVPSEKDSIAKGVFNGRMSGPEEGPLEFSLDHNGVKVSGAMSLAPVER